MSINVRCDECGKGYRLGEERAGTRIRCKSCGSPIEVPFDEDTEDEFDDAPQPARRSQRSTAGKRGRSAGNKGRKKSGGVHPGVWIGGGAAAVAGIAVVVVLLLRGGSEKGDEDGAKDPGPSAKKPAQNPPNDDPVVRALKILRQSGASVAYDPDGNPPVSSLGLGGLTPAVDDARFAELLKSSLKPLVGKIGELSLEGTRVTDASVPGIKSLGNLTSLRLDKTGVTDNALAMVKTMDGLATLGLSGTAVTDKGLAIAAGMPNLKKVYVRNSKVSVQAHMELPYVREFVNRLQPLASDPPSLEDSTHDGWSLGMQACGATFRSFQASDGAKGWVLGFAVKMDDASLKRFFYTHFVFRPARSQRAKFEKTILGVDFSNTLATWSSIGLFFTNRGQQLRRIVLAGRNITDEQLAMLKRCTSLEELDLSDTNVTDRGIQTLASLATLKKLDVRGAKGVTEAGVEQLRKARQGLTVVWNAELPLDLGEPIVPPKWTQVVPNDKAFQIQFPDKPDFVAAKNSAGRMTYTYNLVKDTATYRLTYAEFPVLRTLNKTKRIEMLRGRASEDSQRFSIIEIDGNPAVEFGATKGRRKRLQRICIVGTRIYECWSSDLVNQFSEADARKFITSLTFQTK